MFSRLIKWDLWFFRYGGLLLLKLRTNIGYKLVSFDSVDAELCNFRHSCHSCYRHWLLWFQKWRLLRQIFSLLAQNILLRTWSFNFPRLLSLAFCRRLVLCMAEVLATVQTFASRFCWLGILGEALSKHAEDIGLTPSLRLVWQRIISVERVRAIIRLS